MSDKTREWVYDPKANIPVWVFRRWHKIGSELRLDTTSGLSAYTGDTIREIAGVPALQPKLPKDFWFSELDGGHVWGHFKQDKFQTCARCMLIRRADKKNRPCQGKVKLRSMDMSTGQPV